MVAGEVMPKISSALVAALPSAFDTDKDMYKPGAVTKFKADLGCAMLTRGLMDCIEEMPPTLEDVKAWYPDMNEADMNDKLRQASTTHTKNREIVAALLGQVIRRDNLLLIEQEKISHYMVMGQGEKMWEFIFDKLDYDKPIIQARS